MKKIILGMSIGGVLFAGYIISIKLFSQTCPFNETCPVFLGYPACYFGFVMYALLTFYSTMLVLGKNPEKSLNSIRLVSFFGILFAGYFTLSELPLLFQQGLKAYTLGLPTCAYGLIFYVLIFSASFSKNIFKR